MLNLREIAEQAARDSFARQLGVIFDNLCADFTVAHDDGMAVLRAKHGIDVARTALQAALKMAELLPEAE